MSPNLKPIAMGAANYIFLLWGAERLKRLGTTALLSSYRVYISPTK